MGQYDVLIIWMDGFKPPTFSAVTFMAALLLTCEVPRAKPGLKVAPWQQVGFVPTGYLRIKKVLHVFRVISMGNTMFSIVFQVWVCLYLMGDWRKTCGRDWKTSTTRSFECLDLIESLWARFLRRIKASGLSDGFGAKHVASICQISAAALFRWDLLPQAA